MVNKSLLKKIWSQIIILILIIIIIIYLFKNNYLLLEVIKIIGGVLGIYVYIYLFLENCFNFSLFVNVKTVEIDNNDGGNMEPPYCEIFIDCEVISSSELTIHNILLDSNIINFKEPQYNNFTNMRFNKNDSKLLQLKFGTSYINNFKINENIFLKLILETSKGKKTIKIPHSQIKIFKSKYL